MKNYNQPDIIISGLGVTSAIGQGKKAFSSALLLGQHKFDIMKRPGRQRVSVNTSGLSEGEEEGEKKAPAAPTTQFIGAEISELNIPQKIPMALLRTASFSSQVALVTLQEAWEDANLVDVDPERIGLVVGGSNFQQRELIQTYESYRDRGEFLRPTYGMSFFDSDLCGLCTEVFGIKGFAFTLGGASASGQLAVIQAIQAVQSGQVDVCIAIGALMDLSHWECQGFRSLGAMGSDRFATEPTFACRPFDQQRDGFIYGESCAVLVVEKSAVKNRSGVQPYARLSGWAITMDGNRNPNPSFDGEVKVIQQALKLAQLSAHSIDYINPHGTGSLIGDETELKALAQCKLNGAYLNATKSIIGHGLTAAGAVEIVATLMQMQEGKLHPTRNLEKPMSSAFNWVNSSVDHRIQNALSLSMGFGGVNSALCLQRHG